MPAVLLGPDNIQWAAHGVVYTPVLRDSILAPGEPVRTWVQLNFCHRRD